MHLHTVYNSALSLANGIYNIFNKNFSVKYILKTI